MFVKIPQSGTVVNHWFQSFKHQISKCSSSFPFSPEQTWAGVLVIYFLSLLNLNFFVPLTFRLNSFFLLIFQEILSALGSWLQFKHYANPPKWSLKLYYHFLIYWALVHLTSIIVALWAFCAFLRDSFSFCFHLIINNHLDEFEVYLRLV